MLIKQVYNSILYCINEKPVPGIYILYVSNVFKNLYEWL
jgi:hypothetical protein